MYMNIFCMLFLSWMYRFKWYNAKFIVTNPKRVKSKLGRHNIHYNQMNYDNIMRSIHFTWHWKISVYLKYWMCIKSHPAFWSTKWDPKENISVCLDVVFVFDLPECPLGKLYCWMQCNDECLQTTHVDLYMYTWTFHKQFHNKTSWFRKEKLDVLYLCNEIHSFESNARLTVKRSRQSWSLLETNPELSKIVQF